MAKWQIDRKADAEWTKPISATLQKEAVALRLASRLNAGDVVGIGSGSTSYLTLVALSARARAESLNFSAVASSIEIERACIAFDVPLVSLNARRPDWSFDGADEVAPGGRLIKGRGGAMLREKLLMAASLERYIVVDESKIVSRLGERFRVPIEVHPEALELVVEQLAPFGVQSYSIRQGQAKDGPVITETAGIILDVAFASQVPREESLESLPGVIATGVFDRWPFELVRVAEP